MLEVFDVTKNYGQDNYALGGVRFSVDVGDVVCLLGPSGCGKTTLLRIIAGLEHASSGTIRWQGTDLANIPVHRRNFGMMFQDFALFPHKTVAENVAFGLKMAGVDRQQVDATVGRMLALVNLPEYGTRSVFELSGGERQRVALARSLASSPSLLMLDEPLGSLDRTLREDLLRELRSILDRTGVTTLYVTHDQEEAFAVADRIIIMNRGQIEQIGHPRTIYEHPANSFVARFLGFVNLFPAEVLANRPHEVKSVLGAFPLTKAATPGAYTLLIRPDAVRVPTPVLEQKGLMPDELPAEHGVQLSAVLESFTYRGNFHRVDVSVPTTSNSTATLRLDLPAYQVSSQTGALVRVPLPAMRAPITIRLFPEHMALLPPEP